ncbi:hypothetical protein DdX_02598 [Ditylenchus destructor]|uniref:Uncharacterized protein n=1 Tax=Ditylenchus destructor TaxID=166010 RepID=A0AAD4R672_9BILA|nr:hypothetical protein DdX_02598 [Ditylenchus destructor]
MWSRKRATFYAPTVSGRVMHQSTALSEPSKMSHYPARNEQSVESFRFANPENSGFLARTSGEGRCASLLLFLKPVNSVSRGSAYLAAHSAAKGQI